MNKIDYQALREAAEKATCGVWSLEYGEERFDAGDALIHREVVGYLPICRIEGAHPESGFDEDFQMEQQANAEFIAAASPATVLALLDENESMCRDLIARNGEIEGLRKLVAELEETKSKLNEQREYYEGVISDGSKRIAELVAELVSQTYKLHELSGNSPVTPDSWISCSERMPNDKQYVWCWGKSYGLTECNTFEGYYDWSRNKWWAVTDDGEEPASKVTHWMPLPEPPL
ncbi:TPA: ead/Ea22-like family protein [Escherichia coli]|nr:ead/Ea22-like family protein [Escherichia coli]